MQLVCRVGLAEITAAAPLADANRRAPKGLRRYNYHPDMKPGVGIVLSITNGDGDCELLLSPDAYLREVLEVRQRKPHNNTKGGVFDAKHRFFTR